MTVVAVAGAVANKHRYGGSIWVRMSWAEALRELGFDVLFVEEIDPSACVDAAGAPCGFAESANVRVFDAVMAAFGLTGSAALCCPALGLVHGMDEAALLERLGEAELLVNISGHLRAPALLDRVGRRVFVDLDPGYTQVWAASGVAGVGDHELFCTVGLSVGTAACDLPRGGIEWRPVRQPVVLGRWPADAGDPASGFTTVASWRGAYGRAEWEGRAFGLKAHEFRRLADLPGRVGAPFGVALDIHPADAADRDRLRDGGWRIEDPATVGDIEGFRDFVLRSAAECSPAQGIYVEARTGWFSDRTVRYLASGRPALVQDTGFGDHLPVGEGLLAFSTPEEAAAGAEAILADYSRHAAAARRIAEEHFAPAPALGPLLEAAGVAP